MDYPSSMKREMDDAAVRRTQIEEARRMADAETPARRTITLNPGARVNSNLATGKKQPPKLKGHEAFLKALELSGADVVVEKVSSGHVYYGKLKHSDKFTITLHVTAIHFHAHDSLDKAITPVDRVIFKHDISEFYTTTAPQRREEASLA